MTKFKLFCKRNQNIKHYGNRNLESGKWTEWANKCSALETLIREKHPQMKISLDNKIILNG